MSKGDVFVYQKLNKKKFSSFSSKELDLVQIFFFMEKSFVGSRNLYLTKKIIKIENQMLLRKKIGTISYK